MWTTNMKWIGYLGDGRGGLEVHITNNMAHKGRKKGEGKNEEILGF